VRNSRHQARHGDGSGYPKFCSERERDTQAGITHDGRRPPASQLMRIPLDRLRPHRRRSGSATCRKPMMADRTARSGACPSAATKLHGQRDWLGLGISTRKRVGVEIVGFPRIRFRRGAQPRREVHSCHWSWRSHDRRAPSHQAAAARRGRSQRLPIEARTAAIDEAARSPGDPVDFERQNREGSPHWDDGRRPSC
jgi:hypothetical protein